MGKNVKLGKKEIGKFNYLKKQNALYSFGDKII